MKLKRLFIVAAISAVMVGCGSKTLDDEVYVEPAEAHGLCGEIEATVGTTPRAAKQLLGDPDKVDVEKTPSLHDPSFVNIRTRYDYKDGYLVYYYVPKTNRTFLEVGKFTRKFHPTVLDGFFNEQAEAKIAELGEPFRETSLGMEYPCDEMSDEGIVVEKGWGKVKAVYLKMWVD